MTADVPWRKHLLVAGAVFLASFGLRLAFLLAAADRGWPHTQAFEGDAVIWARAVEGLARGELPDDGVPHRFYAIAYLLHWLHPGAGIVSFLPFKVGWTILSSLGVGAGYLVFARNFNGRVAALATGLYVFSFGSYVLATSLNVEGLYLPLLLPMIGALLELRRGGSPKWLAVLVPLNALGLLLREEHALLVLGWSVYLAWALHRAGASPLKRWAIPVGLLAGSVALCLPYSVHATRATQRYNTVPKRPVDFATPGVRWTAEAQAFVHGLPAFVRGKTVAHVTERCRQAGVAEVTPALARSMLVAVFGGLPEPLATPVFVASHGPLSFALANHPQALGAFSRAALASDANPDPRLSLSNPRHLRLFNHGYAVGLGYIGADVATWIGNVFRKWGHAYQGMALGFTGLNLPLGRYGERRAVDLLTPVPGPATLLWYLAFGGVCAGGLVRLARRPARGPWLLVLGHKALIVTGFYGYARQGAVILPVVFLGVALGVEAGIAKLEARGGWPRARQTTGVALALAGLVLLNLEIHAARHPPMYTVVGPLRPVPQWGEGAYSANAPIGLRERPR